MLTVFCPSTTNLSNWKNWLTTVCLCITTPLQQNSSHYSPSIFHISNPVTVPLRSHSRLHYSTHLHHLQLLQPPLYQLLHLPLPQSSIMIFPKCVFRSSLCVFAEIVGGELGRLAEEGTELGSAGGLAVILSDVRILLWIHVPVIVPGMLCLP